jgi:twinkle protein
MTKKKSQYLRQEACPACGSSDGVAVYAEGPKTCMVCGEVHKVSFEENAEPPVAAFKVEKSEKDPALVASKLKEISEMSFRGFRERKIPKPVTEYYGVRSKTGPNNEVLAHYYPYGIEEITGYKVRDLPKKFKAVGKLEGMFGQSLFNGGRRLVITEGEIDALSVAFAYYDKYQRFYPVVALPGATSMTMLLEQREWVRRFDEVVLLLDNDEAGKKAQKEACKIIGIDKVKVAKLPTKDPNECLITQGPAAILAAIWDAQPWSPSGMISGEKLWDKFRERQDTESLPYPDCLRGVNEKTNGIRYGEVDLFTSGTGSGKSTIMKEIVMHMHANIPHKIGIISLEEDPGESVEKFLSMQLRTNINEEKVSEEKLRGAFSDLFSDGRITLLDHQGSVSDGSLMDKIETLCLMGAKVLILDHLTIAVSEVESSNANEAVDKVMSDLLKIAKKHNVWLGVISHLRKTPSGGKAFEEGQMPSLDDIKGSGSVKQISFQIIAFCRNMTAENELERNTIKVRVLKSRFTGRTGDAGAAIYDPVEGRLRYSAVTSLFDKEEPEL